MFLAPVARAQDGSAAFGPHNLHGAPLQDAAQICVYCHAPASTAVDTPQWMPWNEQAGFSTFDRVSTVGGYQTRGSVSMVCLTCHDGTQAPDVLGFDRPIPQVRRPAGGVMRSFDDAIRSDHPVGIRYRGAQPTDRSFRTTRDGLRQDVIENQVRWWIDTETVPNGMRDKSDVILFTREGESPQTPFVECSSCHDPHGNGEALFLRLPNTRSRLCLACHTL